VLKQWLHCFTMMEEVLLLSCFSVVEEAELLEQRMAAKHFEPPMI